MLYAAPVLLIVAGRIRGCRPEERRLVISIAAATSIAFIPAVVGGALTGSMLVKGCAYAFIVLAGVHWAMLLGARPGEDGRGEGDSEQGPGPEAGPGPEEPFGWERFERGFWEEVRRRGRERLTV